MEGRQGQEQDRSGLVSRYMQFAFQHQIASMIVEELRLAMQVRKEGDDLPAIEEANIYAGGIGQWAILLSTLKIATLMPTQ